MSPVELPVVQPVVAGSAATPTLTRELYGQLARRVTRLSWLSLAWMTVEGAVAIAAGVVASSIALIGFGLDSASSRPTSATSRSRP